MKKETLDRILQKPNIVTRIVSILLVISFLLSLVACSDSPLNPTISDPKEDILNETILNEFITSEIYLQEIVLAESKITELLLEESTISEVLLCKSIYVPQDNIEEFSANSQTAQLFGNDVDISSLLKKVAVGTGVIVTLTVLKKVGLSDPVASVVAAAADSSLKFATSGAMIGSLYGGLTGAADEIDESGRTSAIMGFAAATVGLILSTVSLVVSIPSGGSSAITAAAGVKLVIAGVSVLAATAGTVNAGQQAIKAFTSTDGKDVNWKNIDWQKVGVSAAEKAVANAGDGYMWGSIVGAVYGGADGYDFYHKYNTPYTQYNARLMQTPNDSSKGTWSGKRGESDFILNEPIELPGGIKITKVTYKNAVPDFSPYQKAQVKISNMTNNRAQNFKQANKALAKHWTEIKFEGKTWTAHDVETYRTNNNLTWHEMSNMNSMQLVPHDVNQTFTHFGGVAEYNAMIGQKGATDFD